MTGPRHVLDLAALRNNAACAAEGVRASEGFDGFGRAFPAEALHQHADLLALPADLGHDVPDNIACEGQELDLDAPVRVRRVDVVGAGSGGAVSEELTLLAEDGTEVPVRVRLSDFITRKAAFGERCFAESGFLYDIGGRAEHTVRPRLWQAGVELPEPVRCTGIRFPVNPDMHVFAIWLTSDGGSRG